MIQIWPSKVEPMQIDAEKKYRKFKSVSPYVEEVHCPLVIEILADPRRGTQAAFCVAADIGYNTFYKWLDRYPLFDECYQYGKIIARFNWEQEAVALERLESNEVGCQYELWRLRGWSQFGVGKNSRIRVHLTPGGTPAQHYHDILKSASNGDYTAGEIKQLMEAVNVGLNAYQAHELQDQIDSLKSDLEKMESRTNG